MSLPNKRILVVGSWAKEHITIEKLKKNYHLKVYAFMDTKNPGIISLVDGYKIGSLHDTDSIVKYCKQTTIDMVLITTAAPLSSGLVDKLEGNKIPSFGPGKMAARLETDKAYTRRLMKRHKIDVLPEFGVFDRIGPAVEFAKRMNWQVAVKPIGLTEGLGVRVHGDQLESDSRVIAYIKDILNEKFSRNASVLIEEKLSGEEFTIQCLTDGSTILPCPAVQDFKKLLNGDRGPNTASMGSYSDKGFLLPFMKQKDYNDALDIISKTLSAFKKEGGKNCRGFLYGQFMITKKGLKLIEYNFRPGDPEWLNTSAILKSNIFDIVNKLLQGKKVKLKFENKATVCKYLVPPGYPRKLNQTINLNINKKIAQKNGVEIYYSCGYDKSGDLNTGSERGIALLATAKTIYQAKEKIHNTIHSIEGDFHYRKDIGTKKTIAAKVDTVKKMTGAGK